MENIENMEKKKYRRKDARGILTPKERHFLVNTKKTKNFTSSERHLISSITNKTKKGILDLRLIIEKLKYSHWLFPNEDGKGYYAVLAEEAAKILFELNLMKEKARRHRAKIKRKINEKPIKAKTAKQLQEIIKATIDQL
jgi:hypothetical protein